MQRKASHDDVTLMSPPKKRFRYTPTMPFKFPEHALALICHFLSFHDIVCFGACCKIVHKFVWQHAPCWGFCTLRLSDKTPQELIHRLGEHIRHIDVHCYDAVELSPLCNVQDVALLCEPFLLTHLKAFLKMKKLAIYMQSAPMDECLHEILIVSPNLTELNVCHVSKSIVEHLVKQVSTIQCLTMNRMEEDVTSALDSALTSNAIDELHITQAHLADGFKVLQGKGTTIKKLYLEHATFGKETMLAKNCLAQLNQLVLRDSNEEILELASSFKLRHLRIKNVSCIKALQRFTNLQNLIIEQSSLSPHKIIDLAGISCLKSLTLINCQWIDNQTSPIHPFIPQLNLTKLRIDFKEFMVHDAIIHYLAKAFPNIELVHVEYVALRQLNEFSEHMRMLRTISAALSQCEPSMFSVNESLEHVNVAIPATKGDNILAAVMLSLAFPKCEELREHLTRIWYTKEPPSIMQHDVNLLKECKMDMRNLLLAIAKRHVIQHFLTGISEEYRSQLMARERMVYQHLTTNCDLFEGLLTQLLQLFLSR